MVGSWSRILGAPRGKRRLRKATTPAVLAERREQIGESGGRLGGIPRAHDPAEAATLLEVRGRPQEDQTVDHSGEGGGAGNGSSGLVLGLAEAKVLLGVV